MMDCRKFREVVDLYVDRELSPEARAAADLHLAECKSCRSVAEQLLGLRHQLKAAVTRHAPPPSLVKRVHRPLTWARWRAFGLFAALVLLVIFTAPAYSPQSRNYMANRLEQVAFHLDGPHSVVLEGILLCRDCELQARYGAHAMCKVTGHHGAVETPDGKIWNLMEGETSEALIHNQALLGKKVRIRGRIYRQAGCVEIESYEVIS
jgi:hypothetical protein